MLPRRIPQRHINQRNFLAAVAALLLAAVLAFFGYEFRLLGAPGLEVTEPPRDIAASEDVFDVRGRGDADADLTVNGRPLYSGGTGEFTERIYLVKGVNRLDFEAKNRYGKTTTITRYIVVK